MMMVYFCRCREEREKFVSEQIYFKLCFENAFF